eukprot:4364635-Pyramimonas_sp.AAC.1
MAASRALSAPTAWRRWLIGHYQLVELARTGWAGIVVAEDGCIVGGLMGTVPGLVQETGFAELCALVRVLREAARGGLQERGG